MEAMMEASNGVTLRETMVKIKNIADDYEQCGTGKAGPLNAIYDLACAALATPARNCDVGIPAEAHIAFRRFCRGNYRPGYAAAGLDGCDDCELCEVKNESGEDACPFWWLLAPAKSETKGDANGKV